MFRVCYQFPIAIGLFFTNKETSNSAHEASDKNVIKLKQKDPLVDAAARGRLIVL